MTLLDHIIKQAQFETQEKENRSQWLKDYYKDLKPNEQQIVEEVLGVLTGIYSFEDFVKFSEANK